LRKINSKNYLENDLKYVFADSSYYICFIEELEHEDCYNFLDYYKFGIGNRVLFEIRKILKAEINSKLNYFDFSDLDYFQLFSPLLSNLEKNKTKGEFEMIGLSLFCLENNQLQYLVLDDDTAKKFVKRYFKHIKPYLTGTIGLIGNSSLDGFISSSKAISMLKEIIELIESYDNMENNKFPCNLSKKSYKKIICPEIELLRGNNHG